MKSHFLLIPLALGAFSVSCTKSDTPEETTPPAAETVTPDLATLLDELVGTDWTLVSMGGKAVADDFPVNLHFLEDGRVSGNGSVNRYNGVIKTEEGALKIGPLAATMMAGPEAAMDQESTYFKALESADSLSRDGETLTLSSPDEPQALSFSLRKTTGP